MKLSKKVSSKTLRERLKERIKKNAKKHASEIERRFMVFPIRVSLEVVLNIIDEEFEGLVAELQNRKQVTEVILGYSEGWNNALDEVLALLDAKEQKKEIK